MKITFLGTSHGVPAKDRYCQSMLIETGAQAYLVDAGAPVIDLLLRMDFDLKKLKAVFITHMHGDHLHGLSSLMDLASWYFTEMDFDVYVTEEDRLRHIEGLLAAYPNGRVRTHVFGAGPVYEKDGLKVSAYPSAHLAHSGRPAYGFLIEAEEKRLYISGDLDAEKIDYPEFLNAERTDLFVVECAHFPAEKLLNKLALCRADRTAVVHVFPLDKYRVLEEGKGGLSTALILPGDGDSIII